MSEPLSNRETQTLLRIARESIAHAVSGSALPSLEPSPLMLVLQAKGASFVTLTIRGEFRGCMGEAYQPQI